MINHIEKDFKEDGTIKTVIITSNDNYKLNLNKTYKLANNIKKEDNKLVNIFKNSILGTEVGLKAEGFSTIAILATIIAISSLSLMYIFWRV